MFAHWVRLSCASRRSELKLIVWQGLKTALPRVAEDTDVAVLIDRGNEHYRGFAVGRSIWREPILVLCNRETTQTEAEATIGDNFLAVVDAFESADRARAGQC